MIYTKKLFLATLVGASTLCLPLALITSCSDNSSNNNENQGADETKKSEVIKINQKYLDQQNQFLENGMPKWDENQGKEETNLNSLKNNAISAQKELQQYLDKHKSSLSIDEKIWTESYITKWDIIEKNIAFGFIYLGANPIAGERIISTSSNNISKIIKNDLNIYQLNPETGDPDPEKIDQELVKNIILSINKAASKINSYFQYMKYGSEKYGFMPSNIQKKLFINQMLTTFYKTELNTFANGAQNEIPIVDIIKSNDYLNQIKIKIKNANPNIDANALNTAINSLSTKLKNFMDWYSGDYYISTNSYGGDKTNLKLSKTNLKNEIEKTIQSKNGLIYGLGLSQADLETKNIGIGFMNLKNLSVDNKKVDGNAVYQQMLYNNNSINATAEQIYKKGIELTKAATTNMIQIASNTEKITNWKTDSFLTDLDGIGIKKPTLGSVTGDSDFAKFNSWLNQEDFFFGREFQKNDELNKNKNFISQFWTNANNDSELKKYKDVIIKQGYQTPWENAQTINGQTEGTVSGKQALAGGVLSLKAYTDFKKATSTLFNSYFNKYDDYVLSPYNYDIREFIGVGMEGPRGSKQFQYNSDPYYSLPKWSISSLTTHEGSMGHHTQQEYWTEYLVGKDGINGTGPGYSFINDSYHEGWAVFAEWFTNIIGTYGSNLDSKTEMPQNWLNGSGLVPKWNESKKGEIQAIMKNLHGGVYYDKALGTDTETDYLKTKNSIKLANMLQYYGYLNEAQLRNMRLALDTAVHSNNSNMNNAELKSGASIQDLRNYMKNNSALGIGDIASESIRYAVMPSQATGYMQGKIVFETLFKAVAKKTKNSVAEFLEDKEAVKKFFDLCLRNGEIPLLVLEKYIKTEYKITT